MRFFTKHAGVLPKFLSGFRVLGTARHLIREKIEAVCDSSDLLFQVVNWFENRLLENLSEHQSDCASSDREDRSDYWRWKVHHFI